MKQFLRVFTVIMTVVFIGGCSLCDTIKDLATLAQVAQYAPEVASGISDAMAAYEGTGEMPAGITVADPVDNGDGSTTSTITFDGFTSGSGDTEKSYTGTVDYTENADGTTTVATEDPITITTADGDVEMQTSMNFDENGELTGGTITVDGNEVDFAEYYDSLVEQGYIDSFTI